MYQCLHQFHVHACVHVHLSGVVCSCVEVPQMKDALVSSSDEHAQVEPFGKHRIHALFSGALGVRGGWNGISIHFDLRSTDIVGWYLRCRFTL